MKRLWTLLALAILLTGLIPAALAQGPVGGTPPQAGGDMSTTAPGVETPEAGTESLSGSFVVFDSSVGGDTCYTPGASQTFCFRAESFTTDYAYVYNLWEKFPSDWVVNNAYVVGTPSCTSGSWGTFGWSFGTPSYEVNISHSRYQQPTDHCTAYYCFDVTPGGPGFPNPALQSWYWSGDDYGSPPDHPCSNDNYTPGGGWHTCDEATQPQASIPACVPPPITLTPPQIDAVGCACQPQEHEFTVWNYAGYNTSVNLTYNIIVGAGDCFGPAQVFVTDTMSVAIPVTIVPQGNPGDTVVCEVYAEDSTNPANNDTSYIVKNLLAGYLDPAGWQLEPIAGASVNQWAAGAVGTNPAAAGPVGYIAGGLAPSSVLNPDLQMYDPDTGTWTQLADLPNPRFSPVAGWIDGKLYLAGGYDAAFAATADLQVYDPVAGTWDNTTPPDMSAVRGGGAGGVGLCSTGTGPCLFHVGGGPDGQFANTTLETRQYDPSTNAWTQLDNKPAGSSPNGFILGAGVGCMGYIYVGGDYRGYHEFYRLDATQPAGSQWTQMANIPATAGAMTPAMVCKPNMGAIFLIGGDPDGGWGTYNNTVFVYDIATNTWSGPLPQALHVGQLGSVGLNMYDKVWTVGGTIGSGPISPMPHESLTYIVCDPLFCAELEPFKAAPPAARVGEVMTYTIVISSNMFQPGMRMIDPLPPGVVYNDHLTWTNGLAWYSPTVNTVFWMMTPPLNAPSRPAEPAAPAPAGIEPSSLLSRGGQSDVGRDPGVTAAPTAIAGRVLLDQRPNQSNGIFADASCDLCAGPQVLAENFALAGPETIIQVVLWSGYFPGDTPIDPDDITIVFHQDAGGLPGTVIISESPVAYERAQTGAILFGVHEWMHILTLAAPVTLGPGNYWVEIYNDTGTGTDDFFWEAGNPDTMGIGLPDAAVAFEAPGSTWYTPVGTDLAMQLIAPFPSVTFEVTVTAPCNTTVVNEGIVRLDWVTATFAAATNVWGEGDIAITAPPLFAELCPDSTDVITFTICNLGDCDLLWTIAEMTGTLLVDSSDPFVPVDVTGQGINPGLTTASPQAKPVAVPTAAPEDVLWDQPLSTVNQGAYVDQDFPDFPDYSSFLADDFSNANTWLISSIFVPGNLFNGATDLNTADALTWQIYADNGGIPAGDPSGGGAPPLWTLTLPPNDPQVVITNGSGGFPSNVQLNLAAPGLLPPGNWWLVFYPTAPFGTWGQYGRQPADTTNGAITQFINPGGGFGAGTMWQDWSAIGAPGSDMAFRIEGVAVDIPWVSEVPAMGGIPVGGCTDVGVHFDSTGLLPADYWADLLVFSNDPDTPLVVLPVTMTVDQPADVVDVTPIVNDLVVTFTSNVAGTPPIYYMWDFGDGATSTETTPIHAYAEGGCYTATLDVANACGLDSWVGQVCVCEPIHDAGFTWTPVMPIVSDTVTFTGTVAGTGPFTYEWDFGDGNTGNGEIVTHIYTVASTYTVVMTTTGLCGTPLVVTDNVVVASGCAKPSGANFTWSPLSPYLGDTTAFTATVAGGTEPLYYSWDFGDGSGASGSSTVSYIYASAGTFTVTLTVTNTCGTDTAAYQITVQPPVVTGYTIYLPIVYKTGAK